MECTLCKSLRASGSSARCSSCERYHELLASTPRIERPKMLAIEDGTYAYAWMKFDGKIKMKVYLPEGGMHSSWDFDSMRAAKEWCQRNGVDLIGEHLREWDEEAFLTKDQLEILSMPELIPTL